MRKAIINTSHPPTTTRELRLSPPKIRVQIHFLGSGDATWHGILYRRSLHYLWLLKHTYHHETKRVSLCPPNGVGLETLSRPDGKHLVPHGRYAKGFPKE